MPSAEEFTWAEVPRLTSALQRGDERAFAWLHRAWASRIHRYCFALAAGRETLAGEISQSVWLRLVRHIRVLPDEAALWNWLACAARHAASDSVARAPLSRHAGALHVLVAVAIRGDGNHLRHRSPTLRARVRPGAAQSIERAFIEAATFPESHCRPSLCDTPSPFAPSKEDWPGSASGCGSSSRRKCKRTTHETRPDPRRTLLFEVFPSTAEHSGPSSADVLHLLQAERRRRHPHAPKYRTAGRPRGPAFRRVLEAWHAPHHAGSRSHRPSPIQPAPPVIRQVNDEQLFALLKDTPAALVKFPDGTSRLLVLDPRTIPTIAGAAR